MIFRNIILIFVLLATMGCHFTYGRYMLVQDNSTSADILYKIITRTAERNNFKKIQDNNDENGFMILGYVVKPGVGTKEISIYVSRKSKRKPRFLVRISVINGNEALKEKVDQYYLELVEKIKEYKFGNQVEIIKEF